MKKLLKLSSLALIAAMAISCGEDGIDGINGENGVDGTNGTDGQDFTPPTTETIFENKSNLKPLVAMDSQFNFVETYSLVSSSDVLNFGGEDFRIGGGADGAGLLKTDTGYEYVVNFEDHFAVGRLTLDQNFNITDATYLLNSSVADYARQCSGTMWEKDIHGGDKDLFLSASEAFHFKVKGIDPLVETATPTADFNLPALGEFEWENAVPLPKNTYAGKTVIIGGDDDSSNSEGQVIMYYSENGDADLTGGKIYVLRVKQVSDGAGNVIDAAASTTYDESDFDFQETYDAEFVEIVNGASLTQVEMETACEDVNASHFMRVEDVDYQKGAEANASNVFFAVTGRGPGKGTYNDWGTVYKLELDATNPLEGKLTQVISGNTSGINNGDGNLDLLQSPDNICVTENYIYTQEDPNSFDRNHAAYIYQSDLNGNNPKKVLELVVRQDLAIDKSTGVSGEFGSLIDISDKVGEPDTFMLALQPHYWQSTEFAGVDGGTQSLEHPWIGSGEPYLEGSQIVIIKGLPR
ncbi:hypothetical protein [Wenyingzhuangia sp. 2_MG-2023]|uniref:hypothetical protein n=1 Tax=Wenyingzhuangia sp. 2_MG-2023 TaxID=3062639 RepID=UPI0026E3FD92|nr:hypothetical protein [Wenyingzhuangia sp. 2_MG-2023]MDO6738279.1 hypothetical protein [Wenyingzhuangia sp. 2_MG-2023]